MQMARNVKQSAKKHSNFLLRTGIFCMEEDFKLNFTQSLCPHRFLANIINRSKMLFNINRPNL